MRWEISFNTAWGIMSVGGVKDHIEYVKLPERGRSIKISFEDNLFFRQIREDFKNYFKGKEVNFSKYKISLKGYTEKEKKVLRIVRNIRRGEIKSYKEVAIQAGIAGGARFVGNVMAKNKLPIIIPCHRVIRSDGKAGNYTYGKDYKIKLLNLEGIKI